MKRNSHDIALGGIASALCWSLLLSTGILPFMTYTMPAAAGFVLLTVAFESGVKWAYLAYAAVSALCLMISADLEASAIFITLFGYYPILRLRLQIIRPKCLAVILKTFLFALSVLANYFFITLILGVSYIADEIANLSPIIAAAALLLLIAAFWIYDVAIGNMTRFYIIAVRPKIKGRIRR